MAVPSRNRNYPALLFYYFLIILLPVQLAFHFPASFTQIAGIGSDYLTPTLYLTDLLIWTLIILAKPLRFLSRLGWKNLFLIFLAFLYLLHSALFVSVNKPAAFYSLFKISEFILLFWSIITLKPSFNKTVLFFSIPVIYSSLLAIAQFIIQRSAGGIMWYLGERTFYASTFGIAAVSVSGRLLLRPYATFPHPNVLGGFLAVILSLMIYLLIKSSVFNKFRTFLFLSILAGLPALFLTFSLGAWLVFLSGLLFIFIKPLKQPAIIFFLILLLSILIPFMPFASKSLTERRELAESFWSHFQKHPAFGTGLNNSLIYQYGSTAVKNGLHLLQPVHNIYLFVAGELGILGLTGFLYLLFHLAYAYRKKPNERILPFTLILLLGFFDHYPLTLQQGQLLFVIFSAFALIG